MTEHLLSLFYPENIVYLIVVFFLVRFTVFSFLEFVFTAHPFMWRDVVVRDVGTMFFFTMIIYPTVHVVSNFISWGDVRISYIQELPIFIRFILYLIVGDFFHYWAHRAMHTPLLWRVHRWHHTPKHMSWAAGFRSSFLDATLINFSYILAWPLLGEGGYALAVFLLMFGVLTNDWMHLNVRFEMKWLGKVIVTPRYHHVHHSSDRGHHEKNLSAFFSIWDKLFDTYINPYTVKGLQFGISEDVPIKRLVVGV